MKMDLILCPVDFSTCSDAAVELVGQLCIHRGPETHVVLLNVIEPGSEASEPTSMAGAFTNRAKRELRDWPVLASKLSVKQLTLKGSPAALIVEFARQKKVDVIVMGTHGRTGLTKMLLGSVAQSVMNDAPCPVVVVKPPATAKG